MKTRKKHLRALREKVAAATGLSLVMVNYYALQKITSGLCETEEQALNDILYWVSK